MSDSTLQIDQLLDILEQVDPASPFYQQAAKILDAHLVRKEGREIPPSSPQGSPRTLTIGMATYDDFDGVYFSVQAIRLFYPEVTAETEILVIDNHPEGPAVAALKGLERSVKDLRYVPASFARGTAVRDLIFREAAGEFVLCMDSHVLFPPGVLAKLLEYIESHRGSRDLLQGPLLADDLENVRTHFDPVWNDGMWGVWACDSRGLDPSAAPFEIPMQGLGVFCCRRDAWPGLNPRLLGFGGEEGCLHEKFRLAGGRTLCLPFLRWTHRFGRPNGVPYAHDWQSRMRNYFILFDELGLDRSPILEHFAKLLGAGPANAAQDAAEREFGSPFHFFDAIYCINLDHASERWEAAEARFQALGIAARVRRFPAIETPSNHHIGCALSHRAILAEALQRGLRNVLVFEDDVIFSADAVEELLPNVEELKHRTGKRFTWAAIAGAEVSRKLPAAGTWRFPTGLPAATRLRTTSPFTIGSSTPFPRHPPEWRYGSGSIMASISTTRGRSMVCT
jgi:hypothetical protein